MKRQLFGFIMVMIMAFLIMPLSSFAFDQYEYMNVGETKTFYFPSEVTNRASMMYSYNCTSDHINNVEVLSYTKTSVTVKALAYTQSQVNIRFDYWWYENNYGRNDIHMVHIDLKGTGGGGNTDPDYNPSNYDIDHGCWGTITVVEGSLTNVYCQWEIPNPSKVKSVLWSDYQQLCYDITSQNSSSCTIKGLFAYSGAKLWCLMKYGNTSYKAYYNVIVSPRPVPDIEINSTNFPDDNFRQYLLNQYYGEDGKLTESEINMIKRIDVSGSYDSPGSIGSLKGIEYFTALTSLQCNYNKLTTLDLSKNTALQLLFCYDNQLTTLDLPETTSLTSLFCSDNQLTTLDVSKNTALTSLSCFNNQLTTLDVSKNTALTSLSCYDNQLTVLDVSNALTTLDCKNNQLKTLDVSKNTALTSLKCYNNQLTTLDVSNALTTLQCQNNQLKTLDVSKNTAMTSLECFNNQLTVLDVSNALTTLDCQNNQLTTLDVSKNTALTSLRCNNNQLTSLDLSNALTYLDCSNNQLTTLDLSKNTALTRLYCGYNQLTSLNVSKNTELTYLGCYDNQLPALDVSKNTALTYLGCSRNQLTSLDISKNTALTWLQCTKNQLFSLSLSDALTTLQCSHNQLSSLDVSKSTSLKSLSCEFNNLTSLDLSKNAALTSVHCYINQIKGVEMDNLISSLPVNNTGEIYIFEVVDPDIDSQGKKEGNICTKTQVAAVKAKGWFPCYYNSEEQLYMEYEGCEVPESITLPSPVTVSVGQTIKLTPTIMPSDAAATLKWTSDDETIATVDANGVVTGIKKGMTFINVETDNGKTAYCKLTVTSPEPLTISLPKNVTVSVGGNLTLTPTITPEDAETTLTWTSDDESIVRVDANGMLTGVAEGLALVTVSTSNGLTSNACKVKVEPDLSGIVNVQKDEKVVAPIYTTSGQRLTAPKKGINIIGGKKVIVQ